MVLIFLLQGVIFDKKSDSWIATSAFSKIDLYYRDSIESSNFTGLRIGIAYLEMSNLLNADD